MCTSQGTDSRTGNPRRADCFKRPIQQASQNADVLKGDKKNCIPAVFAREERLELPTPGFGV